MNAKTLEAINKHGLALLAAFPNATEKEPIALCKKLRRVENFIMPYLVENCNTGIDDVKLDGLCQTAIDRTAKLLGIAPGVVLETGLRVNRDPRGYALKFSSEWTDAKNAAIRPLWIHQDWGHYGIVAPDLTA